MKYKETISVIVGTTFFAVPYLALSAAIVPSLVIGAAAYGASELVFSGVKKVKHRKVDGRDIDQMLVEATNQNQKISLMIKNIENKDTQNNLSKIVDTVNKIIKTVQDNPNKSKNIYNFFDYYLPVLLKLVTRYDEIENQKLSSKEGKKFVASADKMIDETNTSFKKILNSLYQSEIVDADAEMKVFNSMLKSDGLRDEININEGECVDE